MGIIFGVADFFNGAIGMYGVFRKKPNLIFVFNIISVLLFLAQLISGIVVIIGLKNNIASNCLKDPAYSDYNKISQWSGSNLCSVSCKCYIQKQILPYFPNATQARLRMFSTDI